MDAYRDEVISPSNDIRSDEEIDSFIAGAVDSAYHPCGTCKMGSDALAVVDADLRVRGIANLRVVDASVFPTNLGVNPQHSICAVAWKLAEGLAEAP